MASETEICQLALAHIGDQYDIASLTENSTEAEICNLVYEPTRDMMLRGHTWGFAKKYRTLVALDGEEPGIWEYMFTYPTDCLKIRYVNKATGKHLHNPVEFEVSLNDEDKKVILCDEAEPVIVYTKAVTNPGLFDSSFYMALSYAVASRIAIPLTGDKELASEMWKICLLYTSPSPRD